MVSFSKVMKVGAWVLVAGTIASSIYDSYQDYVEEEGFSLQSMFGSAGGDAGAGAPALSKKPKKLSHAEDEKLMMQYQQYRNFADQAIQREDFSTALEVYELLHEIVSKSRTIQTVDRGSTLFSLFRLASILQDRKKMAKYAQIIIENNGPNPVGPKLDETMSLYEIVVKDLVEDKKYAESIELVKSVMTKYKLAPSHLSNQYSILANLYNKNNQKTLYIESIHKAIEQAKLSGDKAYIASSLIDLLEYYATEKNREKVEEIIESVTPYFEAEKKIQMLRVTSPIFFENEFYDLFIRNQEEIIPLFETKINSSTGGEADTLKLKNYLLREKNHLACGKLILDNQEEALELFDNVKNHEDLVYTIPSISKYYRTKEALIEDDAFSIVLTPHEKAVIPEGLELVCEFENPTDPDAPTIIEKAVQTSGNIVLETTNVEGIDPSKAYMVKIVLYKKDDRMEPVSKHFQILSPQKPAKGPADPMFQQLL
ncbi:hypothetical protein SAMD00019534_092460 [Acytostelium subglobosum LB1]|uniref:hypothetical protein n=1 Tax=Acytostelium subglobosum LB1 TaxID=1410327 RepID=UPI0006449486|nr:hypothetical protein SAMD00019534_092460 [Acytostelium subglobosum LB1]GAM26071.1 hypothetical protein SAMD00019534_092460 [Acytostelium subglobosum LB1]|eukprot:XP_012751114.1 hypothetical protein SAMD00019534_092460 [Acytostelium subglobosum LB1]